ncbi:hypothetical protein BC940DRAFT_276144 [Gongronella butleri]|nr:hypothetical protein BC940DRAFT_276144 [Gongronella butleri]
MRAAVVVAGLASVVAAQNCNPSWNVTSAGTCMDNCAIQAGSAVMPNFSLNSTSADFVSSLAVECDRANINYVAFMTKAGTCWLGCPKDEQNDYTQRAFNQTCAWYKAHKDDKCAAAGNSSSSSSNSTSGAATLAPLTVTAAIGAVALGVSALLF